MPTTGTIPDRHDITDLLARFGRWLDGGAGAPADFYDADVEVVSPRAHLRGLDAVTEFLARTAGEHTQHLLTDVLIDVDGDGARVSANQLVHFFEPGRPPHRSSGLRVDYRLVRRPAGWCLARMELALAWLDGDLPPAPATT